jgi:hypothetical protein
MTPALYPHLKDKCLHLDNAQCSVPWIENTSFPHLYQELPFAGDRWLKPIILASQEAEIRRIKVRSQPGKIVHKTLSQKILITKKG